MNRKTCGGMSRYLLSTSALQTHSDLLFHLKVEKRTDTALTWSSVNDSMQCFDNRTMLSCWCMLDEILDAWLSRPTNLFQEIVANGHYQTFLLLTILASTVQLLLESPIKSQVIILLLCMNRCNRTLHACAPSIQASALQRLKLAVILWEIRT